MFSHTPFSASQLRSQWMAQIQAQMEMLQSAAGKAIENTEKACALHLNFGHDNIEKARQLTQQLLATKTPQDFLSNSAQLLKPDLEHLLEYARKLAQLNNLPQSPFWQTGKQAETTKQAAAKNGLKQMADVAEAVAQEDVPAAKSPATAKSASSKPAKTEKKVAEVVAVTKVQKAKALENKPVESKEAAIKPASKSTPDASVSTKATPSVLSQAKPEKQSRPASNFPAHMPEAPSLSASSASSASKKSTAKKAKNVKNTKQGATTSKPAATSTAKTTDTAMPEAASTPSAAAPAAAAAPAPAPAPAPAISVANAGNPASPPVAAEAVPVTAPVSSIAAEQVSAE